MSKIPWVKLSIKNNDGFYKATLRSSVELNARRLRLKVSSQDIFEINHELTRTLADIVRNTVGELGNRSRVTKKAQALMRREFEWLAKRGYAAIDDIFEPGEFGAFKEMLGQASKVILDVDSDLFIFPWELLYDDYDNGHVEYSNFWGFKYIIHRNIPPRSGGDPPRPEIEHTIPLVGLIADRSLPKVNKQEIPFLDKLAEANVIKLSPLTGMKELINRETFLDKDLRFFFSQSMELLHFACHTRDPFPGTREPLGEYCLLISKEFPLWREDFSIFRLSFSDYPLIILNACGTSPRHPLATRNVVQKLLDHGARGVITTECIVPDAVAAEFTREFYPRLLDGQALGEVLFETRQSLLHNYNNPLGLLYALYAPPSTRFIRVS